MSFFFFLVSLKLIQIRFSPLVSWCISLRRFQSICFPFYFFLFFSPPYNLFAAKSSLLLRWSGFCWFHPLSCQEMYTSVFCVPCRRVVPSGGLSRFRLDLGTGWRHRFPQFRGTWCLISLSVMLALFIIIAYILDHCCSNPAAHPLLLGETKKRRHDSCSEQSVSSMDL